MKMKLLLSRPKFCSRVFRNLATLCAIVLLSAFPGRLAVAQDIFGLIAGTVTDPTGAAVAHAKVTITNQDTKLERVVTADDRGFFIAPQLPVGTYKVAAEARGFKTMAKLGNDLVAGGHLTVDLALQVGAV